MGSRKQEERNEKIIRGLMKLPPNRRCINCNSLGPQYVCTNFWTFVCMTCSGIHREFTHRVKSVSMSKFTLQEVEALQNGGNQRAREIYLKDWDQQRQRLPDNSNVDKVRAFIKTVYVDKKYAGGKNSDKPPRDLQSLRSHEDDTRRASSYHSYSQSPPYDFQYEDRRYGKPANMLTRKPGSDRGLYFGKMSSFICSPTRLSEITFEDRFANEGSVSRVSDYSVSSGGDPVRSGTESPSFQKDIAFSSPPVQSSEGNFKRDADGIPRPQRATSLGSIGSFDSNSASLKSYNSGSLVDVILEPEQPAGTCQDKMPTVLHSSAPVSHGSLDLFNAPVPQSNSSAGSPIDLFQLPSTSLAPSVDLFQSSPLNPVASMNLCQPSQTSLPSSVDLFGGSVEQQSVTTLDDKSQESSVPKNEGWATFDISQPSVSTPGIDSLTPSVMPSTVSSSAKFEQVSSLNTSMNQNSAAQMSSSFPDSWHDGQLNIPPPGKAASPQEWNAFDNSITYPPVDGIKQISEPQLAAYKPLSTADQYLGLRVSESSNKDVIQEADSYGVLPGPSGPSEVFMGPLHNSSMHPPKEMQSHANHRSTNPFDLPYDSEAGNRFLDVGSLQAALPDAHLSSTFLGGVTQPWFPQDPVMTYMPAVPQGSLAFMAGQTTSPQLANVQTQGPVASVGGNPFA